MTEFFVPITMGFLLFGAFFLLGVRSRDQSRRERILASMSDEEFRFAQERAFQAGVAFGRHAGRNEIIRFAHEHPMATAHDMETFSTLLAGSDCGVNAPGGHA